MLSTSNSTSGGNIFPFTLKKVDTILHTVVFIVGTFGNGMVVYIFGWKKRLGRTTNEFLLLSLGACDLITSFIFPPIVIYSSWTVGTKGWYLVSCFAIPVILTVTITTSQVILILICYDRYRAIVKPLEHQRCKTWLRYSIVIGFTISLVLCIPQFTQLNLDKYEREICIDYKNGKYQILIQYLVTLLRDIVTLAIMSYFIYQIFSALSAREQFLAVNTSTTDVKSFQRTRRILYTVIIVFTLCTVPAEIFYFVTAVIYFGQSLTSSQLYNLMVGFVLMKFLQICNSVANIFIYSAIHPEFKSVYRKIFCKEMSAESRNARRNTEGTKRNTGDVDLEMSRNGK